MSRDGACDQHQHASQAMLRRMRNWVIACVLLLCSGCKDKDKEKANPSELDDIANSVKEKTVEVAGNAKDKLSAAKDKAVEIAGEVAEKAVETGKKAKVELDKVYKTDNAYDLAVDDVGSAEAEIHAKRLEKMPSIDIKGVRVGYEEDSNLSLRGTTYNKHFRASWKRGDKIVRVSFYTKQTLDVVAFAELLAKIVPAVEAVL
jgi:hypothetical protein